MSIAYRRVVRAAASMLPLAVLASCGGGSSGATTPSTVTIGGTVSGLVGTVILQNNAGDNFSVAANGSFAFPTPIEKGAGYAVTVFHQPSGPSCSVTNGSGTATDNVTNVSVNCVADPATAYFPLWYFQPSVVNGTQGLAVVSIKQPGDTPIQVLNGQQQLALVAWLRQSNGNPYAVFYTTVTGVDHLWSLSLTGSSTLVPTQVSNLTFPGYVLSIGGAKSQQFLCYSIPAAKNLNDPSSAFVILGLPTDPAARCLEPDSSLKWVLVHSTDSANTDPVTLPIAGPVLPLYRTDGTLTGLVAKDSANNLNFYPDETFTNPTRLLANVGVVYYWPLPSGAPSGSTFAYLTVLPGGTGRAAGTGASVYRIDSSGTLSSDLYDFQGTNPYTLLDVVDRDHVYFFDSNKIEQIEQGVAQTLYTFPDTSHTALTGYANQHLIFTQSADSSSTLLSLAVRSPGTPATIGTYGAAAGVGLVGNDLLVTDGGTTQILDATGTILRAALAGSAFISNSSPVLMANHISATNSLAGAEIDALDLSQPTASGTPLKDASGATYTFPANAVKASLGQFTANVWIGSIQASTGITVLEYDHSSGVITPITIGDFNVTPFGF